MEKTETPAVSVVLTATAPFSILQKNPDETLDAALQRELNEELTPERALSFFEDATFEVKKL
jgi:hypothetical protein